MGNLIRRFITSSQKVGRMKTLRAWEHGECEMQPLEECVLLSLPPEILFEISVRVNHNDLSSWFASHSRIASLSVCESCWKARCFADSPILFSYETNLFNECRGLTLNWRQRYQLLQLQPRRLLGNGAQKNGVLEVNESGLVHTNLGGEWTNVLCETPFLTSIDPQSICKILDAELRTPISYSGFEYFECLLIRNTLKYDRATAIGVASRNIDRYKSFIGWRSDTVAYHSDDGTIRGARLSRHERFTTGDVVGCGLDWKRGEVFFTKNGLLVGFQSKDLKSQTWYPAVATMEVSDQVYLNFGLREQFRYKLRDHDATRDKIVARVPIQPN